jgi:hypothetical protein
LVGCIAAQQSNGAFSCSCDILTSAAQKGRFAVCGLLPQIFQYKFYNIFGLTGHHQAEQQYKEMCTDLYEK